MAEITSSLPDTDHVAVPALRTGGWRGWWALARTAVTSWSDDYAPSMGAALACYTIFSLAPLLLIVISVAGLLFGEEAVRGELFGQLAGLLGPEASTAVEGLLASVARPMEGIAGTIFGVAVLLFGATTVFGELQTALDRIWRAPARTDISGLWSALRARLLSFSMILVLAFLLLVSLVLGAAVAALGKWWGGIFGSWEILAQAVNLLVGYGVTTVVFAMIYKIMPRVRVRWHDVWLGALVTAALFTIGKFLIGLYIGKSGVASGYGAAGSIVVILVWVYYSAQIFLLGAEFTWVYARTYGSMSGSAETGEAQKPAGVGATPDAPAAIAARVASAAPASSIAPATVAGDDDRLQPAPESTKEPVARIAAGFSLLLLSRYLLRRSHPPES